MADQTIARRVRVSIEHGLSEREAVSLSRSARAFPCELHVNYGRRRIDAKSIVAMLDLSHELDEQAVIELEAEGKDSLQALDRLADLVRHPAAPALDELAFFGLVGNPGATRRSLRSTRGTVSAPWRSNPAPDTRSGRNRARGR